MADDLPQPDPYESEFMGADGDDDVVHRAKMTLPAWFKWFVTLAVLGGLGAGAYSAFQAGDMASVGILAGLLPVMLFMITMMATLRVSVTKEEVNVQYGPIGPTIPIDAIEHCEAEDYKLWKYGGDGIRYSPIERAWCFNMVGDGGHAVRIHYRTDSGRLRKVLIASNHPHLLADAINRVRIARGQEVPAEYAPDDASVGLKPFEVLDDEVVFEETTGGDEVEAEHEEASVEKTVEA